jgi:hypothetical protein
MPDLNEAKIKAIQQARMVRVIGSYGPYDSTVLEDRMTGERRTVPNKWLLAANRPEIAFEMVPAHAAFDADYPDDE